MSVINSDNREAWQALADSCKNQYPSAGKRVRITSGKFSGTTGIVVWHGRDKFYSTRYQSEAQLHLRDMRGREGFRIRIQPDNGTAAFFVGAEHAEVIQ